MKQITAILIGAGARGMESYASYAINNQEQIKFIAVAEPNDIKREQFAKLHKIQKENCFKSYEELLEKEKLADSALICTPDRLHFEPTIMAMEKGYHILLEKPISPSLEECKIIGDKINNYDKVFMICYVLRYTSYFKKIKQLLDDKVIGDLVSVSHHENVGFWHQDHSFVRGNWKNKEQSSPMILQKCSHDMDILSWLINSDCKYISSFGSLNHYKEENAPKNCPQRCTDGCEIFDECAHNAVNFYLHSSRGLLNGNTNWPVNVITSDLTAEGVMKALKETDYGKCVFKSDNNVVDHQVVNMEFENGVTVAFTMCAFTNESSRTTKFMGTKGEIRAYMENNIIEITDFLTGEVTKINLSTNSAGHGGGDVGIMKKFIENINKCEQGEKPNYDDTVVSHIMAFAAEESRLTKKVITLDEF